ncbi:hypothetical protein ACF0H5_012937 [Mactra antiquata]
MLSITTIQSIVLIQLVFHTRFIMIKIVLLLALFVGLAMSQGFYGPPGGHHGGPYSGGYGGPFYGGGGGGYIPFGGHGPYGHHGHGGPHGGYPRY